MAITKRTYNISAFWNSSDVLDAIQTALADVGYHAAAQTGSVLTFTNTAGTTVASAANRRYLVAQSATSGSGVNAIFDVVRSSVGAVSTVTLVRGGKNYAGSDTITIPGTSIGGTSPTDDITVTVSTVSGSQGTTTTWFDADTAAPYTWGVCCVNNNESKRLGQTYYSFYVTGTTLVVKSGTGFQSSTNVFLGVTGLDFRNSAPGNTTNPGLSMTIARTNRTPLKLVTYQSAVDTNFVVFQFIDNDTKGSVVRNPFILSKYSTATQPWDLDNCFTGGIYALVSTGSLNTNDCAISTQLPGLDLPARQGEWGYAGYSGTGARNIIGYYETVTGKRLTGSTTALAVTNQTIYQRTDEDGIHVGVSTTTTYNPIITGLPICNVMVPCPYYMPSDFGVMELPASNAIDRDRISVGATAKWEIILYAMNTTNLASIVFLGRVVD